MEMNSDLSSAENSPLVDNFGRRISYLRLSVTDRCDFRCVYCMAENMEFLPRKEVLSLEECAQLVEIFVSLGVSKVRITGGEPLIRRNVMDLFESLGKIGGIHDLCLTTNGSHLAKYAAQLVAAGVDRVNVSLDSLNEGRFKRLSRVGKLQPVLEGIDTARAAGFNSIKLNTVILRGENLSEVEYLVDFALERELDISFIEEMPLGYIDSHSRTDEFVSSTELRERIADRFELLAIPESTGGPSRYWRAKSHKKSKIGFISPHSENFCGSCNRVRVSATGRLLLCLGNEHSVNLKTLLREKAESEVKGAIIRAMSIKPKSHHFQLNGEPEIVRFMNATGG